jgi:hypothetical protein
MYECELNSLQRPVRAVARIAKIGQSAHWARRLRLTIINIRGAGRPVPLWRLFEVSGPWAQRRWRSSRACIVAALFFYLKTAQMLG